MVQYNCMIYMKASKLYMGFYLELWAFIFFSKPWYYVGCSAILSRCTRIVSEDFFAIDPFYSLQRCTELNYNNRTDKLIRA